MFTGKANFDHEQELIEAFADIGIECLVVWESEVESDPEGVKVRLAAFLEPWV
jgi:G:T-mismatch repair DNA endonuclease (very short patch repair protein)